jgi:hypothetical protein
MRIATLGSSWSDACDPAGVESVTLARPTNAMPRQEIQPVQARIRDGQLHARQLGQTPARMIVDSNAEGLTFLAAPDGRVRAGDTRLELLHERLGVPLVSHLVDPVFSCLRGLPMETVCGALQSPSWHKVVFDRAMELEFKAFGVPSLLRLPQAAPDLIGRHAFTREPLDLKAITTPVSFIGSQSSNYFGAALQHQGDHQLVGAMAWARRAERPEALFCEIYHDELRIADRVGPGDSPETIAHKLAVYYSHKLFFVAMLWVAQRNRYVLFLKQQLGDAFRVSGLNWAAMGVAAAAPVPGYDAFLRLFRTSLININLNNGNTETGLNQRTFEITAAGGFMLCAHAPELAECFRIGQECETFRTQDELLEKIAYYRAHPARAAEIAWAGQQRTLRDHLYSNRLRSLIELTGATAPTTDTAARGPASAVAA